MTALKMVIQEQIQNVYLIWRISLYESKRMYAANILGNAWLFLAPFLQIAVYWIVFGMGIRQGAPINGVPFFVWMICGLIPWFFINSAIGKGTNSIHSRLNVVSKMNFPLSVIPTYVVLSQLYAHLILLGALFVVVIANLGLPTWHWIGIIYGLLATITFLVALSFITSTLATIVRDVSMLVQSSLRMLFFLTPVLWEPKESLSPLFLLLIQANPVYYLIEVYRGALIYRDLSIITSSYTLYFWGIVSILIAVGTSLHVKFRKQFIDYL
ncbi:ABC transporter permease [Ectobacillus antri]|uniref:ABC transporter permease n=1 Tax=Ectobacillus antri TaxID=2486280 RepID=UPI000F59AA5D|nr:ABC transporter permease [Ectobacillus antri]